MDQQSNMSPVKPERGFLDPVSGPPLQTRGSHPQGHENGGSHEDEDVQLVGIPYSDSNDIKTHVRL